MPFTARIYRTLESELNRRLSFSYELVGPRNASTLLIRVCMRNDSGIRLGNIRGTIAPLSSVRFEPTAFSLPGLGPGEQVEIVQIRAMARTNLNDPAMLDRVATIEVTCQADLSSFSFHGSRPLTYSPRTGGARRLREPARRRASSELRPGMFHDRAIPLSK